MKPHLTQTNKQTKKLGDSILPTSERLWKQVTTNAGGRGESITIIYCGLRVSTPAATLEISVEISKRLKTETAMTQLLHSWVYAGLHALLLRNVYIYVHACCIRNSKEIRSARCLPAWMANENVVHIQLSRKGKHNYTTWGNGWKWKYCRNPGWERWQSMFTPIHRA